MELACIPAARGWLQRAGPDRQWHPGDLARLRPRELGDWVVCRYTGAQTI